MAKKTWKLLGTENIFKNQYVTLDTWKMRLPSGATNDFFIHKTYDFVVVVAFTKDKKAVVLEQYYVSQQATITALVAGIIEKREKTADTARRELLEETGYKAGKIVPLGSVIKGKYTTGRVSFLLALDAQKVADQDLEANEDIRVRTVPMKQFKNMVFKGKIAEVYMELGARRALEYLGHLK
jgi:8-oxo-dGTP pyrophosphatase MutT (NUDIX family)